MQMWKESRRYIFTGMQGYIYNTYDGNETHPVSDLVLGCILQYSENDVNGYIEVLTPDGRKGYVHHT